MNKSQLPFLLKEALDLGGWKNEDINPANETYRRGKRVITIAIKPNGQGEYAFSMENEDSGVKVTRTDVINSLSSRLQL